LEAIIARIFFWTTLTVIVIISVLAIAQIIPAFMWGE